MKMITKLAIAASVPALGFAAPASAQVTADSDQFVVNLVGSVQSQCELLPNGSTTFGVNMLNTGNQGSLAIGYSCNSPYTVSLTSTNGGMKNTTSGGVVNIPYAVEASATGVGAVTVNSNTEMNGTAFPIVTDSDWVNILANLGAASGNIDLNFSGIGNQYAVAGDYEDTLTITLAANF